MLGALGTTLFFAITPIFANRAAHQLGSIPANFWRLVVAALLLAGWAHLFGGGNGGVAARWFFVGGVAGFGVGGVAMFMSLPRLGSALSTLIVQCLSAVAAALIEFAWLGTRLTATQSMCAVLTLAGVVIGLLPRSLPRVSPQQFGHGVAWALVSALGQGAGAVLSRKAFAVAAAQHEVVDPGSAAYWRVLGGIAVAVVALALCVAAKRARFCADWRTWPWVVGNALTGPVLGVTCYQWALRTMPAGLVQPIVATAPLLTIPLSRWVERAAAPRRAYYVGAVCAVAGATGLVLAR